MKRDLAFWSRRVSVGVGISVSFRRRRCFVVMRSESLLDRNANVLRFKFCFVSFDLLVLREVFGVFRVCVGLIGLSLRSGVKLLCTRKRYARSERDIARYLPS